MRSLGVPFEMTRHHQHDGRRENPDSTDAQMKAGHLPVKGIMKLLGMDMAKLANTQ